MRGPVQIKKGDLDPPLRLSLKQADGTPIDLTGATVTFRYRNRKRTRTGGGAMTVVGLPTAGVVQYAWQTGDTATAEALLGGVVLTRNSREQTVPTNGYVEIQVVDD